MTEKLEAKVKSAGWARVYAAIKRTRSKALRRGAWYQVVQDERTDRVAIKMGSRAVPVPRRFLDIRRRRPAHFSVVTRVGYKEDPARRSHHSLGRRYVVCPVCSHRVPLWGKPDDMRCPVCGHQGEVGWWED